MPMTLSTAAEATAFCPDDDCPGHAARSIPVTMRTVMWTSRVGANPVTTQVSRREHVVDVTRDEDKVCVVCGKENVVRDLVDGRGWGNPPWPDVQPHVLTRVTEVDEVLPEPEPPTLEERVAELERKVGWLVGRVGG